MPIPVAKPDLGEEEWQAVRKVVESGWVTQGPKVAEFEAAVAATCGAPHAVAVSSCTTALHLALICCGVGVGDEVLVPSMSYIATANAVVHASATPVFAEVEADTFNLDLLDAERRITPRTKAIILVHQLGLAADIDAWKSLAARHSLRLIEDAACAMGSRYRGRPIGSEAELACFSFHPRKLITTGDGGMITTTSPVIAERLRLLRHHGMSVPDTVRHQAKTVLRETYPEIGYNYRLTDIQAAVGIEQLKRLPGIVLRRQELAARYSAALRGHPHIATPVVPEWAEWNVQSYAVRLRGIAADRRDAVMQAMLDKGIATRAGVMNAHREPAYRQRGVVSLPVSEAASDGSLILPLYSDLKPEEQELVVTELLAAVEHQVFHGGRAGERRA